MITALKLFAVVVIVLVNGFFVAAEFAFVGVRRSRIEAEAEAGNKSARRLLTILNNLNAYLSAAQLGITLASLGLGWLGEPTVARLLEGPLTTCIRERRGHKLGRTTPKDLNETEAAPAAGVTVVEG